MKKAVLCVLAVSSLVLFGCGKTDTREKSVIKAEKREKSWKKDAELLREKAEKGDPDAMVELATKYRIGMGVPKDSATGVKWLRRAADLGSDGAMFELGICYSEGEGVERDLNEADKWWKMSVTSLKKRIEAGDASAMLGLGLMYQKGRGVPKDKAESIKWMEKALECGDKNAAQLLVLGAVRYEKGRPPIHNADTVKWMTKSIELGNSEAILKFAGDGKGSAFTELGDCYRDGNGVQKNTDEAIRLYKMAVEKGCEDGKLRLSAMSATNK